MKKPLQLIEVPEAAQKEMEEAHAQIVEAERRLATLVLKQLKLDDKHKRETLHVQSYPTESSDSIRIIMSGGKIVGIYDDLHGVCFAVR